MLISRASIGDASKRRVTSTYSSMVEPHTLAMKRVSLKSSCGRMPFTTCSTPGFCRPMAFNIPAGVSYTRCGGVAQARSCGGALEHDRARIAVGETLDAGCTPRRSPHSRRAAPRGRAKSRPQNFRCRGLTAKSGLTLAMARIIAQPRTAQLRASAMFNIVLFEPEIPPNTGNVIRLCANSGSTLHLVRPLGFELTRSAVRRAGLDYEELAAVHVHASLEDCLAALGRARLFSVETHRSAPLQHGTLRAGRCTDLRPGDPRAAAAAARASPLRAAAAASPCAPATAVSISRTRWLWWSTRPGARMTSKTRPQRRHVRNDGAHPSCALERMGRPIFWRGFR
jgi:hypothetical protein